MFIYFLIVQVLRISLLANDFEKLTNRMNIYKLMINFVFTNRMHNIVELNENMVRQFQSNINI